MISDNNSIFRTNCAITCGTRAYMLRGFLRMSRGGNGVRNSRNFVMFLAHNSTRLHLLEFCLSIFVVSCSSLSSHILKINNSSKPQQKTSWVYLDIAAFQDSKVSLLLPQACEDFARVYLDRKVKQKK